MSPFWKTLLLSATAASIVAAGYAWMRYDSRFASGVKPTLPPFLKMDMENMSEEELEALLDELAAQL